MEKFYAYEVDGVRTLPLLVLQGIVVEKINPFSKGKLKLSDANPDYDETVYAVPTERLSKLGRDFEEAAKFVGSFNEHRAKYQYFVQFFDDRDRRKTRALRDHVQTISTLCDARLRIDTSSLWNIFQGSLSFLIVHEEYRADPQRDAKYAHYAMEAHRTYERASEGCEITTGLLERICRQIRARVDTWSTEPSLVPTNSQHMNTLLEEIDRSTDSNERGRSLEALMSEFFLAVPGFFVSNRIRTETEEIDLELTNNSLDPRLRRESAILLAECKNWSSRCGKNEFVTFREKIENRYGRCSMGFLISWNGFTETATREMLRGSKRNLLIVPVSGEQVSTAVVQNKCFQHLINWWTDAVNT